MVTSLYIASAEPQTGKAALALGVLDEFGRRLGRVAVLRPIVRSVDEPDDVLRTLLHHGAVRTPYAQAVGVTYHELHADRERALSRILDRFHALAADHDAVLVVGSDYTDVTQPAELALNAKIAANIGAPVALVVRGTERTAAQIHEVIEVSIREVRAGPARVFATFVTRVEPERIPVLHRDVSAHLARSGGGAQSLYVLPQDRVLAAPTVDQLREVLDGRLLGGAPDKLKAESFGFLIAGMTLPRVLERIYEGATVVVAGDRSDIVLGMLAAHASLTFPHLSALVLNGGIPLEPVIARLVDGARTDLPIIATREGTYATAQRLSSVTGRLRPDASAKIERALTIFRLHVDGADLIARLAASTPEIVTPMMFEHMLTEKAHATRVRIVLPEGAEPRILRAVAALRERDVADLVLLGDPDEIRVTAHAAGIGLGGVRIVDPHDPALVAEFAQEYARLRAHRGITLDAAHDRVVDVSYFGTMYVLSGRADGMVSGAVHTTAHTIRPAVELLRDLEAGETVSSAFFMCLPDRVQVFADCAIVPSPSAEQLADIAISSAGTTAAFGIDVRVAMLSYSTGSSGSGQDVDKVRQATALVRERAPQVIVEGPLQFDAAVDPAVAATKLPDSPVAGRATVLIFPDLNTGNNTYKAVQRSAGAVAIGPVLQGLRAPVNDLSRGATVADIVNTVAVTAVQAGTGATRASAAAGGRPGGTRRR